MKRVPLISNSFFPFYLQALWEYYDSYTLRGINGIVISFGATARIEDGREAIYTGRGPVVASYSSRGPDVNSAVMQTADVLKPNIMAPGSSIWAAWSPRASNDQYLRGTPQTRVRGATCCHCCLLPVVCVCVCVRERGCGHSLSLTHTHTTGSNR